MNLTARSLLVAALLAAVPALGQAAATAPLGEEAETDIEVINGVPVNPELKEKIMLSPEKRSVQELINLSNQVLNDQQTRLANEREQNDTSWMGSDPLGHLEGEMSELVSHIDESNTANQTQAQGEDVVRKMDALIALMEQACSACSSCAGGNQPGNRANGGQPANDSTLTQGPGGSGELLAAGQGNNQFGELDPEQREEILRSQQQGFPAGYDALLAEYYQRLAAEQALDQPDDAGDE